MLSTQQRPPVQNLGSQNLLAHGEWIAKKWSGKTFAAEMQNELPALPLSQSEKKKKSGKSFDNHSSLMLGGGVCKADKPSRKVRVIKK